MHGSKNLETHTTCYGAQTRNDRSSISKEVLKTLELVQIIQTGVGTLM